IRSCTTRLLCMRLGTGQSGAILVTCIMRDGSPRPQADMWSSVNRTVVPGPSVSSVRPMRTAEANVNVALLVCALFLQRFSLDFRGTSLSLDFVPVALILVYQFVSGRLLMQYDRFLWFIVAALAVTGSLLMNFKSTMLSSYFLFIVV